MELWWVSRALAALDLDLDTTWIETELELLVEVTFLSEFFLLSPPHFGILFTAFSSEEIDFELMSATDVLSLPLSLISLYWL